jgi:hypothetical protein
MAGFDDRPSRAPARARSSAGERRRGSAVRRSLAALAVGTASLVSVFAGAASAALITSDLTGALEPADLAQQLAGAGVTISNVTFTGADVAAGQFTGGTDIIGFEAGVILSSGEVADVVGPNVEDGITGNLGLPGDDDLDELVTNGTNDATVLEFDFVPTGAEITFEYVFASDEYNEFVFGGVNDVFALYVNGTNCATVPAPGGGTTAVNIDTVNGGNPFGDANAVNAALFRNNDLQDGGGSIDTEMDGLTVVLTCTAAVNEGVTNHMKFAIADTGDSILDSNVFIRAGSIVVVNDPPVVDAGPGAAATEGSPASLDGTVSDPDGDPLTSTWTFTAGAGVDPGATCTFAAAGAVDTTITCTDDGTYTATLTVSDGTNPPVADSTTVTISNADPTVDITSPAAGTDVTTGDAVAVTATLGDAGANDTHTCSIDWGDGTTTAGTVAGGTCTGSHAYATAGTRTITVTVTDDDGGIGSDTTSVDVSGPVTNLPPTADAGPPANGAEGSAVALDGTSNDPEGAPLTSGWSYVAGAGVDPGATCSFAAPSSVDTTITCTDDGTYTATLTVSDGTNPPVADSTTVTISNADPTVTITSPADLSTSPVGASVSLTAALADAGANDTHTCSIDWGDGAVTPGTVSSGSCTGSHTYGAEGPVTIAVTVTDDDGGSGSDSIGLTITPGGDNQPPTIAIIPVAAQREGWPFGVWAIANDPDGDALTYAWSVVSLPSNDAGSNCDVSGVGSGWVIVTWATITCNDDGLYELRVTATDTSGAVGVGTFIVQVANKVPIADITSPAAGSSVAVGETVHFSATIVDDGSNDTHTCLIDWGDGTTSAGTVAGGTCTGSHVYTKVAPRFMHVFVTDDDGGVGWDGHWLDVVP